MSDHHANILNATTDTRSDGCRRCAPIPALLCIDVEPDERCVTLPALQRWAGFESLLRRLGALRAGLEETTGRPAHFGWFLRMDPQVEVAYGDLSWAARHHGDDLSGLLRSGDELGLHSHSWRWARDHWVSDQADAPWVAHCAEVAFDAFEAAFGRRCRAYRHGDRFMSDDLLVHIAARGAEVDLTLEPGMPATAGLAPGEATRGTIPAVGAERNRPHLSALPGAENLMLLPLTSGPSLRRVDHGGSVAHETLVLWTPPRLFAARLESRLRDPDITHLAFAIRSDIAGSPVSWAYLEQNLAHLSASLDPALEWVTPSEARTRLIDAVPSRVDGWPGPQGGGMELLAGYAGSIERALLSVELDLFELRTQMAADRETADAASAVLNERLASAVSHQEALTDEVARLGTELAELRGTAAWRAHQRLLPVLRALRRVLSCRGSPQRWTSRR